MQESLVFLILGVGRLREDQLIYVETRGNVFFYDMGPLSVFIENCCSYSFSSQLSYVLFLCFFLFVNQQ